VAGVVVFLVPLPQSRLCERGKTCPTFSASGSKYTVITYGSTACKTAQSWLPKLDADKDPKPYGFFTLQNGPKGFHCMANRALNGPAASGECYSGTLAFPKNGFQWNA
jgi:hypothetical protein